MTYGESNGYHKHRVKRNSCLVHVDMNPVEHPHGGGNHQHIGHASTVRLRHDPLRGHRERLVLLLLGGLIVSKIKLLLQLPRPTRVVEHKLFSLYFILFYLVLMLSLWRCTFGESVYMRQFRVFGRKLYKCQGLSSGSNYEGFS